MSRGILVVISGPSGTGKGTVCKEVLQAESSLRYSISATTRQPRSGEQDGVQYYFLTKKKFQAMITAGDFLEWAQVYDNYYGTPLQKVNEQLDRGEDVLLEIDTQGALNVMQQCPAGVFIYILPPSLPELANRLTSRGTDAPEAIRKRLSCACQEINCSGQYDYVVVNDDIKTAAAKVRQIIAAEKCRSSRNHKLIDDICSSGQ